jgi:signal transduction histidine kinase
MNWLKNIPVRRKLIFVIMLTSAAVVLLACVGFSAYEFIAARHEMIDELSSTAAMVADNSSAALAFDDVDSAKRTLDALSVYPHIVVGVVYDKTRQRFAVYRRRDAADVPVPARAGSDGYRFARDEVSLYRRIELANEAVGTVYIRSDLGALRDRGQRYAWIVAVVMLVAAVPAYLLSAMLQTAISGPIQRLAHVVGRVSAEKDYSLRVAREGEDELGRLIDGFNEMLGQIQMRDRALMEARSSLERRIEERQKAQAELEVTHRQLLDASRQAGMAEIATNVLHNVGNVLNSVNVSATLVAELSQKSQGAGVARVVALMREHERDLGTFITSDSRGKHLPTYLAHLAEHLRYEQDTMVRELDSLRTNVGHIKDIVAMQQSYAKVSGVSEIVGAVALMEDCLRLNAGALSRHQIEVIRDFDGDPSLNVDKHKVLQILVNLVRNAKHACEDSGESHRRITLRVRDADGRVRISVVDNGVGIAPENLTRIFNHGFTTRASGHGFGLHSGALAARELGGSLTVRSEGVGRGATFTLDLPRRTPETVNSTETPRCLTA